MTILPKKKHPDGKKNETNSNGELRHSRSRNNCARNNSERSNRTPEDINNDGNVYRAGNLELRGSAEGSNNGKRRYRSSTNDYRRRDEAGYNSEDEYDVSNSNEQPTEEVSSLRDDVVLISLSSREFLYCVRFQIQRSFCGLTISFSVPLKGRETIREDFKRTERLSHKEDGRRWSMSFQGCRYVWRCVYFVKEALPVFIRKRLKSVGDKIEGVFQKIFFSQKEGLLPRRLAVNQTELKHKNSI